MAKQSRKARQCFSNRRLFKSTSASDLGLYAVLVLSACAETGAVVVESTWLLSSNVSQIKECDFSCYRPPFSLRLRVQWVGIWSCCRLRTGLLLDGLVQGEKPRQTCMYVIHIYLPQVQTHMSGADMGKYYWEFGRFSLGASIGRVCSRSGVQKGLEWEVTVCDMSQEHKAPLRLAEPSPSACPLWGECCSLWAGSYLKGHIFASAELSFVSTLKSWVLPFSQGGFQCQMMF